MAKLGASLIVPSVQELVKQPITQVPERYVRPNQDPPVVVSIGTTSFLPVPVIDLNQLLLEDATELEKLDHACKEWGFFQLINHGVNPALVENFRLSVQEFFNLPLEEKMKLWQTPEDAEGFGQLFVVSEDQKLDWADIFFITTLPLYTRNPRLFSSIPQSLRFSLCLSLESFALLSVIDYIGNSNSEYRDIVENYSSELHKLCSIIIGLLTKALKIKPNELLELFEDASQAMRMNYYPLCPQPERVIGQNPHSDAGALTILLQVNETEGLQIRKDGMWIPVQPLSNAFVINIGDMLEVFTNGIYRSVEHRATVNSEKERISIATFHRPGMNRVMGPVPSLVTPERPALFKRICVADYYKGFLSRELQGKSYIDVIRIQNETDK